MKTILLLTIALCLTASAQTTINPRAITVTADGTSAFAAFNQTQIKATTGLTDPIADAVATAIRVDSGADISKDDLIKIDAEVMLVTAKTGRNLTVTRAALGTTAAAHAATAGVQVLKYQSPKKLSEQFIIDGWNRLVEMFPPSDIVAAQNSTAATLATRKAAAAQ